MGVCESSRHPDRVSVSVRAKNSDQLQTHLRLRLHLPLKRRHERFLLRPFNSSTLQLFNSSIFLPAPAGLNVCSPGQGRQAAALG